MSSRWRRPCGCPVNSLPHRKAATAGTTDKAGITAEAVVEVAAAAEAAGVAAAAAAESTRTDVKSE